MTRPVAISTLGVMDTFIDNATRREALEHHLRRLVVTDPEIAPEIYHDDAVLEFPQSGERFEGVENFREWHAQYPADVAFRLRRLTGSGDVWAAEVSVSYDGGPWMLGVALLECGTGYCPNRRERHEGGTPR